MTLEEFVAAFGENADIDWLLSLGTPGASITTRFPPEFALENVYRFVWGWSSSDWPRRDFGAIVSDFTDSYWYLQGRESRSLQFYDHEVWAEGPVGLPDAFGELLVPREDRDRDPEGFARCRWYEVFYDFMPEWVERAFETGDHAAIAFNVPETFKLENMRRRVWGWYGRMHGDFGTLVVDELGWFWYVYAYESRSIAWEDHEISVEGPVDARRAFDPLFIPLKDREKEPEAFERARRRELGE